MASSISYNYLQIMTTVCARMSVPLEQLQTLTLNNQQQGMNLSNESQKPSTFAHIHHDMEYLLLREEDITWK